MRIRLRLLRLDEARREIYRNVEQLDEKVSEYSGKCRGGVVSFRCVEIIVSAGTGNAADWPRVHQRESRRSEFTGYRRNYRETAA